MQKLKRIRVFHLCDSMKEMEEEQIKAMTSQTFKRILAAESNCLESMYFDHYF